VTHGGTGNAADWVCWWPEVGSGAVLVDLSLPLSTGPVESQISWLKMIKRTISGRAGFDLLCHRVLEVA